MAKGKTLFMETTRISANKTAQEINMMLGRAGARRVMTEYENGEIVGVFFQLRVAGSDMPYRLPIRVEPVLRLLRAKRRRVHDRQAIEDQARRVAWRQAYRWLQAQLAFAETEMVELAEVFLPYVQVNAQQTLYEQLATTGKLLALAAPKEG